ncbi:MAG: hypothetical protein JXR71_01070 [Bacteroidales bacterium]|nr:hypothetical protein [Bacteroidales bacterium]
MNSIKFNETDPTDDFLKEAVRSMPLEKPGEDFLPSLMEKIKTKESVQPTVIHAAPIIPAKGWVLITSIVVALLALLFSTGQGPQYFPFVSGWFSKISIDFSSVPIPKLFMVGLIVFLFYFVVEIVFISRNYRSERSTK